MVTSKEAPSNGNPIGKSEESQNSDSELGGSKVKNEERTYSMLPEEPCDDKCHRQTFQNACSDKHPEPFHQGNDDTIQAKEKDVTKESTDVEQEKQSAATWSSVARANAAKSLVSITPKKESEDSEQKQSPDIGVSRKHSDLEGSLDSIKPQRESDGSPQKHETGMKESDDLKEKQSPNIGVCMQHSNQEESLNLIKPETKSDASQKRHMIIPGTSMPKSNEGKETCSGTPIKVLETLRDAQGSKSVIPASHFETENFNVSVRSDKLLEKLPLRRKLESGIHALNSGQERSTSPRLPDKVSEDGYSWRKYGQKLVKGNEFIRSYYKCTYPNCLAKKKVERSHDGPITDINYLGKHVHPKREHSPSLLNSVVHSMQSRSQEELASPNTRDKLSNDDGVMSRPIEPTESAQPSNAVVSTDLVEVAVSQLNNKARDEIDDGDQYAKKQKRDRSGVDVTPSKPNTESRFVVQTLSVVDLVDDGYRWRKYGQKLVKGSPNPRSYYRCSNIGCPAKKHVERASHDAKMVITTYEGQHYHETAPTRSLTQSTVGTNKSAAFIKSEPKSNPEGNESTGVDAAVQIGTN